MCQALKTCVIFAKLNCERVSLNLRKKNLSKLKLFTENLSFHRKNFFLMSDKPHIQIFNYRIFFLFKLTMAKPNNHFSLLSWKKSENIFFLLFFKIVRVIKIEILGISFAVKYLVNAFKWRECFKIERENFVWLYFGWKANNFI